MQLDNNIHDTGKAPLVSPGQLLWELTSACDKSQACKETSIPLNRTQWFSKDFHLIFIIMSIKAFTISSVYEVSLFGKVIRVADLRGFISVSLIFSHFLHVCRIFSWLWINSLYRVSQEECARLWEGVPYVKVYWYKTCVVHHGQHPLRDFNNF